MNEDFVVTIVPVARDAPVGKLADAELHFLSGPLKGLRLVGFTIWGTREKQNVTFPNRVYSVHGERREYRLLRLTEGTAADRTAEVQELFMSAYTKHATSIRVGDTITHTRPHTAIEVTSVVASINLCLRQGDKYGEDALLIPWDRRAYGYFKVVGGEFVYGRNISASS